MRTLFLCAALALSAGAASPAAADELDDLYAETAVDRAAKRCLKWLASVQQADGSWSGQVAITSLSLLAFAAQGHLPERGPYGQTVARGLDYLLAQQQDNGILCTAIEAKGPMYHHGISTLLLGELVGMGGDKARQAWLAKVFRKGIALTLKAQAVPKADAAGGWRYKPGSTDSDMSVSGWQIMSLRVAQNTIVDVPDEAIRKAVKYVKISFDPAKELFCYEPFHGAEISATAIATLSLQMCGAYEDPLARRGGDVLLTVYRNNGLPWGQGRAGRWYFYTMYYATQALYQRGGEHWKTFQPLLEDTLVRNQNSNGSWSQPPGTRKETEYPEYASAMSLIALSVSYQYMPVFQR